MTKKTKTTELNDADLDQVAGGFFHDQSDNLKGDAKKTGKHIHTLGLGSGRTETDESKASAQRIVAEGGGNDI